MLLSQKKQSTISKTRGLCQKYHVWGAISSPSRGWGNSTHTSSFTSHQCFYQVLQMQMSQNATPTSPSLPQCHPSRNQNGGQCTCPFKEINYINKNALHGFSRSKMVLLAHRHTIKCIPPLRSALESHTELLILTSGWGQKNPTT